MLVYLYSADTQCHHRYLSTEICYQPYYYTKYSALTQENLSDSKIENLERRVDAGACERGGLVSNADAYWIEEKPNATSPKSVKWVNALQKADR